MTPIYPAARLEVRSMRLASGEELLVAELRTPDGRVAYGLSFKLDATEARHMAEGALGLRPAPPPPSAERAPRGSAG